MLFGEVVLFNGELFEESCFNILNLGLQLLGYLVLLVVNLLDRAGTLSCLSSNFEVFLSTEFSLENCLHHFFFFWLQSVVVECATERHH